MKIDTIGEKWKYKTYSELRKTYIYFNSLCNNYCIKDYIESYNGDNIIFNNKIFIKNGDTLNSLKSFINKDEYQQNLITIDLFWERKSIISIPYIKNDTGIYLNEQKQIIGFFYKEKFTQKIIKKIFYNYLKNHLSQITIYNISNIIDSTFYKNGKLKSYKFDNIKTTLNKKGAIDCIEAYSFDDSRYYYKSFAKNKLSYFETTNFTIEYYKNGAIKTEMLGNFKKDYVEKLYKKNGVLEEERCFDENLVYIYNKKGFIKKCKKNRHKAKQDLASY